ncbi:hypothetical protein MCOR07_002535 [Pyricularia oryzae]|nr:hypothetical protein MCOR06_000635 [Pyricularia oryzae]KAI6626265.1 hypothetical protein MCOR07_002535 [Pyricularia oryzae]
MTAYNATMTDSANGSPPSTKRGSPDTQHRDYPANRHIPYYYSPASDGQQTSKRTRTEESMTGSPSTDSTLTPPADSPLENEDQSGSVTPELPSSMGASSMAGYPHPLPTETGSHQQDFFNPFVTPFWNPYGSNGNGSMCLASSLQTTRSVPAYEKMPYDGPSTWQKPPMMANHQDFLLAPPTTTGIPRCSSFPTSGPSSTKKQTPDESHHIDEKEMQLPQRRAKELLKIPETHGTWEKSPYGVSYNRDRHDGLLRTPEWYRQQGYYVDEDEDEAPPAKNPNFGGLPRNIDLVARENRKRKAADPSYTAPPLEESLYMVHLEDVRMAKKKEQETRSNLVRHHGKEKAAKIIRNADRFENALHMMEFGEPRKISRKGKEKERQLKPMGKKEMVKELEAQLDAELLRQETEKKEKEAIKELKPMGEKQMVEELEAQMDAELLRQEMEKKSQDSQAGSPDREGWVAVQAERRRRRKFLDLVEQYERECPYVSESRPSTASSGRGNSISTSDRGNGKIGEVGGNWTMIEMGDDDPFVSKDPKGDSNISIITTTPKEHTSQNLQNKENQLPTEAKDVSRDREDTLALYRRQKEAWAKEDRAAAAEAKVDWQPLTTDKAIWEQQKQLEMWNRRKQDRERSDNAPTSPKSDASLEATEQRLGSLDLLAQKTKVRFANLAIKIHDQSKSAVDKMMDGAMDMHVGEKQLRPDVWRVDREPKAPAQKPPPRIILKVGGVKKQTGATEAPIVLEPETGDVVASREEIAEQKMLLDMHKRRHEETKISSQASVQPNTKENNTPMDNGDSWSLVSSRTGYKEEAHSPGSSSLLRPVYFRTDSGSTTASSISSSGSTPQAEVPLVSALEGKTQADSPVEINPPSPDQMKEQTKSSESCFWTPDKWLSGQGVPQGVRDPISEGFKNEWTPIFAPPSDTRAAVQIAKAAWSAHMAGKPKETPNKEQVESAEQAEVVHREHRKSQAELMHSPAACLSEEEYCKIWAEWARLTRIKLFRAYHGRRLPEDEGLCEGMLEAFLEMMARASVGAFVSHGEALKKEYHRFNSDTMSTINRDPLMQNDSGSISNGSHSSLPHQGQRSELDSNTILYGQEPDLADTLAATKLSPHSQQEVTEPPKVHQLKAEQDPPPRVRLVKKFVERGSLQRLDRNNREYYSLLMGMVQEQWTAQDRPQANSDTDTRPRAASSSVSEPDNQAESNDTQKQCEAPNPNQPAVIMAADVPSPAVPANVSQAQARAIEFFRLQMEEQEDKDGWIKMQAELLAMMHKSQETRRELEESKQRLEETRAQFREQWGEESSKDEDPYPEGHRLERMDRRSDTTPATTAMSWDTNVARQNAQADLRRARARLIHLLWTRRNHLEREQEASWAQLPSPHVDANNHRTRRDLGRVKRMLNQLHIASIWLDPPEEFWDSSDGETTLTVSAFGSDEVNGGGSEAGNKRLGTAQ